MAVAITQVRALWRGTWYTMTLDPATGDYIAQLTAPTEPGRQEVTAEAVNAGGKTGGLSRSLLIRAEPDAPEITFTTPPGWYKDPNQPISFQLRDANQVVLDTLVLTLDGSPVTGVTSTAVTGGYDCVFTPTGLSDGTHTLTVSVQDDSENEGTASFTWQIDATAPTLAIGWPAPDTDTNQKNQVIFVRAGDDGSGLDELTINGNTVELSGGAFSLPVTLALGYNDFVFRVTDQAGNVRTENRRVLLDMTAPEISEVTFVPDADKTPYGNMFRVTVTLKPSQEPKSAESVTGRNLADGQEIQFTGEGLVFTGWAARAEAYVLTLTAQDRAGNASAPYRLMVEDPLGSRLDWDALSYLNASDLNRIERNTRFIYAAAQTNRLRPHLWMMERGVVPARTLDLGNGQTLTIPEHEGWVRYDPCFRDDIERIVTNVQLLKYTVKLEEWRMMWRDVRLDDKLRWETFYNAEYDLQLMDKFISYLINHKGRPLVYSGQIPAGVAWTP